MPLSAFFVYTIQTFQGLCNSLEDLFSGREEGVAAAVVVVVGVRGGGEGEGWVGGGCLSSAVLRYTCLGQGWLQFVSERTPLQMCGGSRVAAMYSKSASEASSICGVERGGVVSPGHRYKRKFVLPGSHESSEEAVWFGGGGGG